MAISTTDPGRRRDLATIHVAKKQLGRRAVPPAWLQASSSEVHREEPS